MHSALLATLLAPLCISMGSVSPLAQNARTNQREIASPFLPLEDQGISLKLRWSDAEYAALDEIHASQRATQMNGVALPGGVQVDLTLTPIDPWEENGKALVVGADGITRRLAPSIRMFRIRSEANQSAGYLGVSPRMVHGVLSQSGMSYSWSNAGSQDQSFTIKRSKLAGGAGVAAWCQTALRNIPQPANQASKTLQGSPELRITTAFIEVDRPLRRAFNSSQEAVDYATLLVGIADDIYRRDLGVRITIPDGYLRVWNRKAPWGTLKPSLIGATKPLSDWWNSSSNPLADLPRTQVHALTRRFNPFTASYYWGFAGGIGVIGNQSESYAVTSIDARLLPTTQYLDANNGELYLFAHESGHLFGSIHTQDYVPAISCDDGSGPDMGTLMSYCYGPSGNSVSGIGMRFHARVQSSILGIVDAAPNVVHQSIRLGDYDANGILDPSDLAEFDAYQSQGFVSTGSVETFDMDANGLIESKDRGLLIASMAPKASAVRFNGTQVNRVGLRSLIRPLLGETWQATIQHPKGAPLCTMLVASPLRLTPPIVTSIGELLIQLPAQGIPVVFQSIAMSDGRMAVHDIPLPFDPSLAGLLLETQGMILAPSSVELLNGLSLRLSSY